jgi:hypothetical protein
LWDLSTATTTSAKLYLSHLRVGHTIRDTARASLHGTNRNTLTKVLRDLLVRVAHATATLLGETTRVLAWSSTGDTSHHHTGLRSKGQSALTSVAWNETLLSRTVENSGLHVL